MAALALVACGAPALPVLAQQEGDLVSTAQRAPWAQQRSIAVSYADLNLLQDDGVARLNSRVKYAAKTICDVGDYQPLTRMLEGRQCFAGAMGRARIDIAAVVAQVRSGERLAARSGGKVIRLSSR